MKNIIQKAIEGGYIPKVGLEPVEGFRVAYEVILLDPLFWQCLGKSLGWSEELNYGYKGNDYGLYQEWQNAWHSFIDHIAEGKDIEEFFNNLINNK